MRVVFTVIILSVNETNINPQQWTEHIKPGFGELCIIVKHDVVS